MGCAKLGLPGDLVVLEVGPELELVLPLVHGDAVGDQAQHALLDARRRGDAHQRLARPTRQHYDACSSSMPACQYPTLKVC